MLKIVPIIPSKLLADPTRLKRVIENVLDARAADIKVDFKVTTFTWKNKPDFTISTKPGERLIYTTNLIYKFITRGTRPHIIRARNVRCLRFFRTGFRPKSRVRYIGANKGATASKNLTLVRIVKHPGFPAREFDKEIAEKWQKQLPKMMQQELNKEAYQ